MPRWDYLDNFHHVEVVVGHMLYFSMMIVDVPDWVVVEILGKEFYRF